MNLTHLSMLWNIRLCTSKEDKKTISSIRADKKRQRKLFSFETDYTIVVESKRQLILSHMCRHIPV